MKKPLMFFVSLLLAKTTAFAAGSMTLEGIFKGYSPESVLILDGGRIYSIQKTKLEPSQLEKLSHLKLGAKVTLQVL